MNERRRQVLKQLVAAAGTLILPEQDAVGQTASVTPRVESEVQISSVSENSFRLTLLPIKSGHAVPIPFDGSLAQASWGTPVAVLRSDWRPQTILAGAMRVRAFPDPLAFKIENAAGEKIQEITIDQSTGATFFETGNSPIFGLGEGGPQFDRRGSVDQMISGQGGYHLKTHGGRVPIPWIISTSGWAMFIHQPFGTFDFTQAKTKFKPENHYGAPLLDLFFIVSREPATIMAEYARLTGHPEMPPLWSFGYQQSHRTLASSEEVLDEAKTFRVKKLPCDALIYLGTGFCPSGWNTENGSFAWNSRVFPDPKQMLDELHKENFHAVLHAVILSDKLRGNARDTCELASFDEEEASCYWDAHRKDFALGVDGWWPDEGDPLDIRSRLVRNRMYWGRAST